MKIERVGAGDVMRNHGLMDVHRAFGFSRRARGEVDQRHIVRRHGLDGEIL
jgi:hypothetical protein